MVDNLKVMNFLQDFGCARLEHLQILFEDRKNNFKSILHSNMISKKHDVFVHNTRRINNKMIIALDILCKYKVKNRLNKYSLGYDPIVISFISNEHLQYHIIVADKEDEKGIVKKINSYPLSLPKADKLILAFPDREELENIDCQIPFLYTSYPNLKVINE